MLNRSSVLASLGMAVIFLVSADVARAEKRRAPKQPTQPKIKFEPIMLEGTISGMLTKGFTANASTVKSGKKQGSDAEWRVAPVTPCTLLVKGTAKPSFLKKDQTISFSAALDDQNQPTDKVSKLTIVATKGSTPKPAVTSDTGEVQPKNHGIAADATTKTEEKTDAGAVDPAAADPDAPKGKSKIIGKIISRSGNQLTVQAGVAKPIVVELAESPTINVSVDDRMLPTVGSKVTIHGRGAKNTPEGNCCYAKEVEVTLTAPLEGKEKPASDSADKDATPAKDTGASPGTTADAKTKDAPASSTPAKSGKDAATDATAKDKPAGDKPAVDPAPAVKPAADPAQKTPAATDPK